MKTGKQLYFWKHSRFGPVSNGYDTRGPFGSSVPREGEPGVWEGAFLVPNIHTQPASCTTMIIDGNAMHVYDSSFLEPSLQT